MENVQRPTPNVQRRIEEARVAAVYDRRSSCESLRRRVPCDQAHGFAEEAEAGRDAMPGRGAGRMREWNQIEGAPFVANAKGASHDFVELLEWEELRDGEFADWDDQLRSQEIDLIVHPARAIPDFVGRRDAVAAAGGFSGKAATDGGEVNSGAHLFSVHSAKFLEPTEERAPRRPRERFSEHWFFHSGRLTNEHDFTQDGSARDWRWQHSRAAAALA
jgi:hypothetical protein